MQRQVLYAEEQSVSDEGGMNLPGELLSVMILVANLLGNIIHP